MRNQRQCVEQLAFHACNVRRNIVRMVHAAQSGHPGGSLSSADVITSLYFNEMNIDHTNLKSNQRDRFVLSKGHASPLLYSVLAEKGFIKESELLGFRQIDSMLQGHPNMNYIPGVDMSTGSLGQGISCAVGMAMANKLDANDHRVYVLVGDGECEEGEVWEAAMAAAHYQLDNLCAILDYNGLQIDGALEEVISPAPFEKKFESFGWNVLSIDGHDLEAIGTSFEHARSCKHQPTIIIAKTIKGKGVSYMEHNYAWHGSAPNDAQYEQAMIEMDKAYGTSN